MQTTGATTEPVAAPGDVVALTHVEKELAEIRTLLRSRGATTNPDSSLHTQADRVDPAHALSLLKSLHQRLESEKEAEQRAVWKAHLFLDRAGVLSRFGKPKEVYADSAQEYWSYDLGEGETLLFQFHDGLLFRIDS